MCTCAMIAVWKSGQITGIYVCPRHRAQVISLSGKCFYPLDHISAREGSGGSEAGEGSCLGTGISEVVPGVLGERGGPQSQMSFWEMLWTLPLKSLLSVLVPVSCSLGLGGGLV